MKDTGVVWLSSSEFMKFHCARARFRLHLYDFAFGIDIHFKLSTALKGQLQSAPQQKASWPT